MAPCSHHKATASRSMLAAAGLLMLVMPGIGGVRATDAAALDRSPEFRQCITDSGGVTAAMQDCMGNEYRRLDRALNMAYRGALRRLPSDTARSRLRALQRTWLKNRWDVCTDEVAGSGMGGGSGGLVVEGNCRLRIVADRTQWLRDYPQPLPYGR